MNYNLVILMIITLYLSGCSPRESELIGDWKLRAETEEKTRSECYYLRFEKGNYKIFRHPYDLIYEGEWTLDGYDIVFFNTDNFPVFRESAFSEMDFRWTILKTSPNVLKIKNSKGVFFYERWH